MKKHYNILYLSLEFDKWNLARPWTYQANLGLEDGFLFNKLSFFTVTTPWLSRLKDLCYNKTFDQVWVEIVHQNIDIETFEWIKNIAPIRVGLVFESLTYNEFEVNNSLVLKERRKCVEGKINYLTYLIAIDEVDVNYFYIKFGIPSFWWISCMPKKFINKKHLNNNKISKAVFSGTVYGKRIKLIENTTTKNLIIHQNSPDKNDFNHFIFDSIHLITKKILLFWPWSVKYLYTLYMFLLRSVRKKNFKIYLKSISNYSVVLNLPSLVKAFPGRVSEAMSVGSVVLSNIIKNRPQNNSVFIENKDIIFYDEDNPDEFNTKLKSILDNDNLRNEIAINCYEKVSKYHTMEIRILQIQKWISKNQ